MGFLSHYTFEEATVDFDGQTIFIICHDAPFTSAVWQQLSSMTLHDKEWQVHLVNAELVPPKESISLPLRILVLGLDRYVKATNEKTDYHNYIGLSRHGIHALGAFTRFLWRHSTDSSTECYNNFAEAVKNALPPCTRRQKTRGGTCSTGVGEDTSEPEQDAKTTGGEDCQVSEDRSSCCTETSADSRTGGTQKHLIPTEEPQPAKYPRLLTAVQLEACLSAIPPRRRPKDAERTLNALFYARMHGWPVPEVFGNTHNLQKLWERYGEKGQPKRKGQIMESPAPRIELVSIFDKIIADQKPSSSGGPAALPALPAELADLSEDQKMQVVAMLLRTINKTTPTER